MIIIYWKRQTYVFSITIKMISTNIGKIYGMNITHKEGGTSIPDLSLEGFSEHVMFKLGSTE